MQGIVSFIQYHASLSAVLVAVVVLLIIVEFMRLKRNANQVTPAEMTRMVNHQNAVIVDIRDADSFRKGHIVDAVSLPLSDLEGGYLKKRAQWKSRPLILVSATGQESLQAAALLSKQMEVVVFILAGGLRAWIAADLPLIKGA